MDTTWMRTLTLGILTTSVAVAVASVTPLPAIQAAIIALSVTAFGTLAWIRDRAERRTRWERGNRTAVALIALGVEVEALHLGTLGWRGAFERLKDGFPALLEAPALWGLVVMLAVWFALQMTLDDLYDLGEPWDVTENGTLAIERLHYRFMMGAILVVGCGGAAASGVDSILDGRLKGGVVWPAAIYLPVGLAGLMHARRSALERTWRRQHVLADSRLAGSWRRSTIAWLAGFWAVLFLAPIGGETPVAEGVDGVIEATSTASQWLADRLTTPIEDVPATPTDSESSSAGIGGQAEELQLNWWLVGFLAIPASLILMALWELWKARRSAIRWLGHGSLSLARALVRSPWTLARAIAAMIRDFQHMMWTARGKAGTLAVVRVAKAALERQRRSRLPIQARWEPTGHHARRVTKIYRRFVAKAVHLIGEKANETPRELLGRIVAELPDIDTAGTGLTHLFEETRYSTHEIGPSHANEAAAHLHAALSAIKHRFEATGATTG